MALKNVETFVARLGLVETIDPAAKKPIYRKPGFEGVVGLAVMEERLSRFLRRKRDTQRLNRSQVGMMIGIHPEIYARHERAGAKLTATRLLHLAELFEFSPIEAVHAVAPQFLGDDQEEANMRLALILRSLALSASAAEDLLNVIEELPRSEPANGGRAPAQSSGRA